MTPQLSVVIPAFNEQESLEATVKAVVAALPDPARSELVIVNDGSTDGTLAVATTIAESSTTASVVVVDRPTNGGMGQALASGFARATGDVITWIPGDGEYDLDEVLIGLENLESSDIVLVRRNSRGQVGRNIVSSIMYGLIRVLFRVQRHGLLRDLHHRSGALAAVDDPVGRRVLHPRGSPARSARRMEDQLRHGRVAAPTCGTLEGVPADGHAAQRDRIVPIQNRPLDGSIAIASGDHDRAGPPFSRA